MRRSVSIVPETRNLKRRGPEARLIRAETSQRFTAHNQSPDNTGFRKMHPQFVPAIGRAFPLYGLHGADRATRGGAEGIKGSRSGPSSVPRCSSQSLRDMARSELILMLNFAAEARRPRIFKQKWHAGV
jgi:hypothetical protein